MLVDKQMKWWLDLPLIEATVTLADRMPANQELQKHLVWGAEEHQPGPKTPRKKAVKGPEIGKEVVQRVGQATVVSSDHLAQANAAECHATSPPAEHNPAPSPALRSLDATDDITGLQNPWVFRQVVVTPRPDVLLKSPVGRTTGDRRPGTDGNDPVYDRLARLRRPEAYHVARAHSGRAVWPDLKKLGILKRWTHARASAHYA